MTDEPEYDDSSPNTKSGLNRFLRLFVLLGLFYFGLMAMFAGFQRRLIYVPTRGPVSVQQAGKFQSQLKMVSVTTHDGLVLHGWLATPYQDLQPRKLVVLFSGNGGNRGHRAAMLNQLSELGWHSLLIDYRGYAENPGSPNETDFAKDAHTVIDYAITDLKFPISDIVICGQSLGGGVATRVAAELCERGQIPGGLILRATFTSLVDAGAHNFPLLPVRTLIVDRYPSIDRIKLVTCPIFSMHGMKDRIVPYELGQALFNAAPEVSVNGVPKRFLSLPNSGHNDIMYTSGEEVHSALESFLAPIAQGF